MVLDYQSNTIDIGIKSEFASLHSQHVLDEKDMILMILMAIGSLISMMFFLICIRKMCSTPPDLDNIDGLSLNSSKKLKFINMNVAEKKQFISSLQNEEEWSDSQNSISRRI